MHLGTYDVQFDQAGRMTIPSRLRSDFGDEVIVTVAMPPQTHLTLFDAAAFETYVHTLFPPPTVDLAQQNLKRLLLGNAYPLKLDKAGRVLIPQSLREFAGLTGPARVIGNDQCAEIMSAESHDLLQRMQTTPQMQAMYAQALAGLTAAHAVRQGQGL